MSELLFKLVTVLHIGAGSLALICGPVAIAVTKGMKVHRFAGKVFFFSMITVALSAFYLSIVKPNPFLFVIAGFSLYMVSSGFRLAHIKRKAGDKASAMDWILTIGMAIFALSMIGYGAMLSLNNNSIGIVLIVFGVISTLFVVQDIRFFNMRSGQINKRLVLHIGRMIGATIAAYTAFLVVNNTVLPGLVAWLGPTVLGVPFIVYWSIKYSSKKKVTANDLFG